MKVLVISGFLGAGKTTFIKELIQRTGKELVVLENEYGTVDIDSDELKSDSIKVWELTEGCVCCTVKANFATSILTIENTLRPEYLIVEPTGIGMLSAIMENIKKIAYEHIEILSPISIVDSDNYEQYSTDLKEFYLDQIKNAGIVLISKTEDKPIEAYENIVRDIKGYNPKADVILEHYSKQPIEWWNGLFDNVLDKNSSLNQVYSGDSPVFQTVGINGIKYNYIEELISDINILLRGEFGKVYRAKGRFLVNGMWTKLNIVGDKYEIETSSVTNNPSLVIIGLKLDKKSINTMFKHRK